MGEAEQRKNYDVRLMTLSERQLYVTEVLASAKALADGLPDGDKLYAAFEPMLRFVVSRDALYLGGCHYTSAVLFMQLLQAGLQELDVALCIGEVKASKSRFDHSWVEVRGQVFDIAICAPNKSATFSGGPIFAGIDLNTNEPSQVSFGVESMDKLGDDAAIAFSMSLSLYFGFQKLTGGMPVNSLISELYGGDDYYAEKLLSKYGEVNRRWRNAQLNPEKK